MATTNAVVAASRKHVELSLELKRKLIQEHEHGVPFTLLGKKYHIATSTAANIWRKKDFFLRSRMSGSRKRCNDRSKYKIVNQVTALFVKSMLERNHKIDGEVIKRFARTAAAQCNFKDFHGSNGWLDSFKKRENVCWVRRRGERSVAAAAAVAAAAGAAGVRRSDSPNLSAAAAAALAATAQQQAHRHSPTTHRCFWSSNNPAGAPQPSTTNAMAGDIGPSCSSGEPNVIEHHHHHHHAACARCDVAAAAAAVAALNSSDSLHERDHEIEDWFHGIPFLCQFFEEYQSMRQAEQSQAAAVAAASSACVGVSSSQQQTATSSSSSSSSACALAGIGQQQQTSANLISSAGGSSGMQIISMLVTSNLSSASPSSCSLSGPAQRQSSLAMAALGSSSSAGQASTGQNNGNQQQQQSMAAARSLSDACDLMDAMPSTTTPASASASNRQQAHNFGGQSGDSLADIQSLRTIGQNGHNQSQQQLQRTMSTEMLSSRQTVANNKAPAEQYSEMAYNETTSSSSNNNKVSTNSSNNYNNNNFKPEQADFSQLAHNAISSNQQNNNNEQLMEINFTSGDDTQQHGALATMRRNESCNSHHQSMELQQQQLEQLEHLDHLDQQQQQQARFCQLDCSRTNSNHSETSAGGQCATGIATTVSSDYNSDDPEFYLPAARYITQDAQSENELLYHDEVSDHNDCCSDHYDQSGAGSNGRGGGGCELQLHDYQAEIIGSDGSVSSAAGNGGGAHGATCYMEEYEYENISTIRHYPVPMPMRSQANGAGGNGSQASSGATTNGADGASSNNRSAPPGANQSFNAVSAGGSGGSLTSSMSCSAIGAATSSQADESFLAAAHQQQLQQQQRQANNNCQLTGGGVCNSHHQQQSGFVSSPSCSPISASQQQQQQMSLEAVDVVDVDAASHHSALMGLQEHEQSIEHADHEEHNLLHNALMRSPEKLKLIDSIITLLNYASNYNQKWLAPLVEIKRCIERDLEVVLTTNSVHGSGRHQQQQHQHQHQHHHQQQQQSGGSLGINSSMSKSCDKLASGILTKLDATP